MLNLTLTYSPISLFRWQMYAAQSMKNKWYGMFGGDMLEDDTDQDSLKVHMNWNDSMSFTYGSTQ